MKVTAERLEILATTLTFKGEFSGKSLLEKMSANGFPIARSTFYRNRNVLIKYGAIEIVRRKHGNLIFKCNNEMSPPALMRMISGDSELKFYDVELSYVMRRVMREYSFESIERKMLLEFQF